MVNANRWGTAAIVAALALGTPALAQQAGSQMGTGGQRDPGSGTTRSTESSTPGTQGSSTAGTQGSSSSPDTGMSSSATSASRSASAGKLDKGLTEAVQKLHAANQAEVEMGQMAQQMATSQEVKDYGQKLATDHQKNDQKLTTLAESLGVDLNGKAFQDEQKSARKSMDKLHGKSGADFDKAFMSMMVKDHEKDTKDVRKAADEAKKKNQTELASYLTQTHTGLQGHLQLAQRIEKDLKSGKSSASRGSDASSSGTGSSAGTSGSSGTGATSPGGGTGGSTTGGSGTSGTGTSGTRGSETGGGGGR